MDLVIVAVVRVPGGGIFPSKEGERLQIVVRDNNVDQALKALKKKMQREGIFREMKLRSHYEKPSEKRAREKRRSRAPRAQTRPQARPARRASARKAQARPDRRPLGSRHLHRKAAREAAFSFQEAPSPRVRAATALP